MDTPANADYLLKSELHNFLKTFTPIDKLDGFLGISCYLGDEKAFWIILKRGANINGSPEAPSLILSCSGNHISMLNLVLKQNGDVNMRKNEFEATALMAACEYGYIDFVKILIKSGCDLNLQDVDKKSALHYAVRAHKVEVVKILIESGCNLNLQNTKKETPLIIACGIKNLEIVKLLVKAGCDTTIKDSRGNFALDYVSDPENTEIARLIFEIHFGMPIEKHHQEMLRFWGL